MNPPEPSRTSLSLLILAAAVPSVLTAGNTWDGGGANAQWQTAANWNPDGVPAANTAVVFTGNVRTTPIIAAAVSVSGITFDSNAAAFTFLSNAGDVTTVGSGGIVNNDGDVQTFNTPLLAGASQTWSATSGDLAFLDSVQIDTPRTVTLGGAKEIACTARLTGTGSLILQSSSVMRVGNTASTLSGGIRLLGGTLAIAASGGMGLGTLQFEAGIIRAEVPVTLGNLITFPGNSLVNFTGTNTMTFTGPVSLGFTRALTVSQGTTVFNGAIGQSGSGSGLTKNGAGTLILGGAAANTFNGPLTVNNGTLVLQKSGGVAPAGGNFVVGDGISALGEIIIAAPDQIPAAATVTVNRAVLTCNASQDGFAALTMNGAGVRVNGGAVLKLPPQLTVQTSSGAQSAIIADTPVPGSIEVATPVTADIPAGAITPIFATAVPLTGSAPITKNGSGTWNMSGSVASTYSGVFQVNDGLLLLAKSAGAAALNGQVNVGGAAATAFLNAFGQEQFGPDAELHLLANGSASFGSPQTLSRLVLAGRTLTQTGGSLRVTADISTLASSSPAQILNGSLSCNGTSLTVSVAEGAAAADLILNNVAVTNGTLLKSGAGTMTLSGGGGNSANLRCTAGTLALEKSGADACGGVAEVSGGVLEWRAADQVPDGSQLRLAEPGVARLAGVGDTLHDVVFANGGQIEGSGTLKVASTMSVSDSTSTAVIQVNTLELNGGTVPVEVADGSAAVDLRIESNWQGGTLEKRGAGTLRLAGSALNPAGGLILTSGVVDTAGAAFIIGPGVTVVLNGGTFSGPIVNHGTLVAGGGTLNGTLSGNGQILFSGGTFTHGGTVLTEDVTIGSGVTVTSTGAGLANQSTLTLDGGTLNGSALITNEGVITGHGSVAGSGGFTNSGSIAVSGGNLSLANTGASQNLGSISVTVPRRLSIDSAFSNSGLITLGGGSITGSSLLTNLIAGELRGGSSITAPLLNNGGLIRASGTGVLTLTNLLASTGGGELRVDDGAGLAVTNAFTTNGIIHLAGINASMSGGTITNHGTIFGRGRLTNTLVNNGVVRAEGGVLTLVSAFSTNPAGGRLEAPAGGQLLFTLRLAANEGTIALSGGAFDNNNQTLLNSGRLEGYGTFRSGGLTNSGAVSVAGSMDLMGPVINSGTVTTAAAGTTRFYGPVSGAGSYPGPGTVVFLDSFSPGASPASVSFNGGLELAPASTLVMELGGSTRGAQYDSLEIAGTAQLAGALEIAFLDGYVPAPGTRFTLLSAGALQGTFSGLPEGSRVTRGDSFFRLTYAGGTGHEVELLTLNPEAENVSLVITRPPSGPGSATVTATGIPGLDYLLESSSDLKEWSPEATRSAIDSGALTFPAVPLAADRPRAFFRIRRP
jgi:fibronectin-binding autotransporter adhesin